MHHFETVCSTHFTIIMFGFVFLPNLNYSFGVNGCIIDILFIRQLKKCELCSMMRAWITACDLLHHFSAAVHVLRIGLMTFGWEILKSLYSTSSRKFELSNRKIACDMNEYEWMMLAMKRIPMALVVKSSRDRWKFIIILFLSLSRDMFDRNCCVYYFCSSFIKSYFVSSVFYAIFSSKFRNFNS